MQRFTIKEEKNNLTKKFNLLKKRIDFVINDVPANENLIDWFKAAIEDVSTYATKDLNPNDQVGVGFCAKSFELHPGWLSFRRADLLTTDDIWEMISKIFQSNSEGLSVNNFCLSITSVRLP